ncbi:unnamed protein product [Ceratitis capitata]|uniref:(Mediterranean fruit fly) hypothetical protein n=1 Tax=Ceratitis capitata TaxID=7213 RepID=A0A811VCF2_CERCA|nr:unnamed protein product [Ceratitis capitata]
MRLKRGKEKEFRGKNYRPKEISKQMLLATQSTTKSRQSATKVVNNTLQLAGVDRNMLSTVFVDLSARTSHYLAEKYRTGCYECACLAAGAMNWQAQQPTASSHHPKFPTPSLYTATQRTRAHGAAGTAAA